MATLLENGDQFIGSHMKAEAGQNGGLNPSSTMGMKKGETLPRSKIAKSILGSDPVIATAGESFQTRTVSAAPTKAAFGMRGASAGGKIQSVLDRGGQRQALTAVMARQKKYFEFGRLRRGPRPDKRGRTVSPETVRLSKTSNSVAFVVWRD